METPVLIHESLRNFSFSEFLTIFKTTSLDISKFWLVNSGYDKDGNKKFVHIIIRACQIRPFFGPHLVSIMAEDPKEDMRTFWVTSLTHLRRNLFNFTDRLSFERSTYIVPYEDNSLLIRIKAVRSFLIIPQKEWNGRPLKAIQTVEKQEEEEVQTPSPKSTHLLDSSLQQMLTFLSREHKTNIENTIHILREYVHEYCDRLENEIVFANNSNK